MALWGKDLRSLGELAKLRGPPNYGLDEVRANLMRKPSVEVAMRFWDFKRMGKPVSEDAVLAGVHKARVVWPGSTPEMVQESKLWLLRRGLKIP